MGGAPAWHWAKKLLRKQGATRLEADTYHLYKGTIYKFTSSSPYLWPYYPFSRYKCYIRSILQQTTR